MSRLKAKCTPDFHSDSLGKLGSDVIVRFTRHRSGDECDVIGFRESSVENATAGYSSNWADRPDEVVCGMDRCDMTGTVTVDPVDGADGVTTARVVTDVDRPGERFQPGYTRFMIWGNAGDKFAIYLQQEPDSTDKSKFNVTLDDDGWNVVILENPDPDEIVGNGWIGTEEGFVMVTEPKQDTEFKLSTLQLFKNAYELVQDEAFEFSCVDDFSGDPELTITEDPCDIPTYDEEQTKIERSMTAHNFTGKFPNFGSLTRRIDQEMFPVIKHDKYTAKTATFNGVEYSSIVLPDLADIQCPSILVQPQDCEFDVLTHLNADDVITTLDLPDEMFFRIDDTLYMSPEIAGREIVVSYPTMQPGVGYQITSDELNRNEYSMEVELPMGQKRIVMQYDHVLLTAIPWTWTKEAGSFEVPFTVVRDQFGNMGKIIELDLNK